MGEVFKGRLCLAVLLAAALVAGSGAPGGAGRKARARYWKRTEEIAPGATWTRINLPLGPNRVHVVSLDLAQPSTLDVVLGQNRLPGFETTSSMARRSGAFVAINGDYARPSGRPVFTFARDGVLEQTKLAMGRNFALNRTETAAYLGFLRPRTWLTDGLTGEQTTINRVNVGPPASHEIVLFTPSGGTEERPPEDACAARLYYRGGPRTRTPEPGVAEDLYVHKVACRHGRMARRGGVVIATPRDGKRAGEIATLLPGQQLSLSWSLESLVDVVETVGGNPTLIENGEIVWGNVEGDAPFLAHHPRSGIGTTPDGRLLLVTVDGRQKGYSVGMTLRRFARLFATLGADWALNLDGGGSTTMWVHGRVRNRPSDGAERPVSSALVLLPGADEGEAPLERGGGGLQPPPLPQAAVWKRIARDPASTGGLFDTLARRGAELPPALHRIAEQFRRR